MALENDPQIVQPLPLIINGKGATSNTDPTYNVRMLMASENSALKELMTAKLAHMDENIKHVEDTQKLHVGYQEKLTVAESNRINAIRAVDVGNLAIANERAAAQASVLATQLASSAETLRTLVASTAASVAVQFQQVTTQLTDRLAQLEKAQYVGAGSAKITDPIFAEVLKKLEAVVTSQNLGAGKGAGANALWGYIIGGIGALAIVLKMLNVY